tara:strand:- start:427 stop:804 length:378 start_codon:yes stop_codon:yes gene_type:complete
METAKRCCTCREVKLLETFHKDAREPDGRRPDCASCRNAKMRRIKQLRKTVGEPPLNCQCCGRPAKNNKLSLDHDHSTGEFRGWLCQPCNKSLGRIGDNLEGVLKFVNYLLQAPHHDKKEKEVLS